MKKTTILAALLIASFSVSAYAADLASGSVSSAGVSIYGGATAAAAQGATSPLGKLSTGVRLGVNFSPTSYALLSKHDKGSKIMGTANDSTAIYYIESPQGALTATPSQPNNTAFATGYTSM